MAKGFSVDALMYWISHLSTFIIRHRAMFVSSLFDTLLFFSLKNRLRFRKEAESALSCPDKFNCLEVAIMYTGLLMAYILLQMSVSLTQSQSYVCLQSAIN